ncbi:MAG: hypothetical protein HFF96_02975 [Oscillibacter sp.]|uniref:hypothetical protein n=1 Tax=Oscillibacter sp. TaxID=1945593 RepID=UPI00216CD9C0|nr:hypothetical protein [Oscillibacter sp.]MCI9113213.1 hypothetical protein [Oscillibacter sp.]
MRRDYFSRLSRAARWFLPPAEAAEVLEDYREIVAGRSEEELRRDLGTPRAAMRQLAQPKAYRRWLAAFAGLTVCLLLPSGDVVLRACLKTFDKNGGVGDNRKKQAGAGENASIPK